MSENLTKLAHKIDFSKDESEEKGKPTSEGGQQRGGETEEEEEKPLAAPLQASLWPWDSVRSKLRSARRAFVSPLLCGSMQHGIGGKAIFFPS